MDTDRVQALQDLTERLWARAQLGPCVRIARDRQDCGAPHVEVLGGHYEIVITERGQEIQRLSSLSALEAARWFVFQMASKQGSSLELQHRMPPENAPLRLGGLKDDGYSRWNWMAPTIEIMRRVAPDFGDWALDDYNDVFRQHPLAEYEKRNSRYPLPSSAK